MNDEKNQVKRWGSAFTTGFFFRKAASRQPRAAHQHRSQGSSCLQDMKPPRVRPIDTPSSQSWQPVEPRSAFRHLLERTAPDGQKEYFYSRGPVRPDGRCKFQTDPEKAIKYGRAEYAQFKKKQATADQQLGLSATALDQPPAAPEPQHRQQPLQASAKRPASPQGSSLIAAAASTNADPVQPPQSKKARTWQCGNGSSGKIPWEVHVAAAGQKQSQQEQLIKVTPGDFISKIDLSALWTASVRICGSDGLAALKNPPPSLTALLGKHKCCGRCCTGGLAQHPSSGSGSGVLDGTGDGSAGLVGAEGGSGEQVDGSCSCSVQVGFKFARPYAQLGGADKAAYGSPERYAAVLKQTYIKEWRALNDASSTGSHVLSGYAVGELRNGSHMRPCMLLELSELSGVSGVKEPASSPAAATQA